MRTVAPVLVVTFDPRGINDKILRTKVKPTTVRKAWGSQTSSNVLGNLSKGRTGLHEVFVHRVCSETRIRGNRAIINRAPTHSKLKLFTKGIGFNLQRKDVFETLWSGLGMAFFP